MFNDFQITRPFGIIGGTLFVLVGLSCALTMKSWVETPINRALAKQVEERTDPSAFDRVGGKEKFDEAMARGQIEQNKQITIGAIGTVCWGLGLFSCFVRSLWSPRCVLIGAPFKIWANFHLKDNLVVWFDVAIFVMALIIWMRWEKESA